MRRRGRRVVQKADIFRVKGKDTQEAEQTQSQKNDADCFALRGTDGFRLFSHFGDYKEKI
jgi:hypothetical protein